jgi:hypothetical protein
MSVDIQATATIRATCSARTGEAAGDYSLVPLWCRAVVGLRSYVDASGVTRWYCGAPNHKAAVRRRYPEAELPEAEDPITAYKVEQERQGLR